MEDLDLIACLYPKYPEAKDKHTWDAIRMNTSRYILPRENRISDYRSRESTVSLEAEKDSNVSYPALRLTFTSELKCGKGLMFGTDPNCDIVLPNLKHVSKRHCYLTFDEQRRLVLRDCSSRGTIVKYDEAGGELRRSVVIKDREGRETCHDFTWILSGHPFLDRTQRIYIEIHGIDFEIVVPKDMSNTHLYRANVDRFLQEVKTSDELPIGRLGVQSTSSTARHSGAHTPNQGPLRLKQATLGKGTFAVVKCYWDVSTGVEYAYKEPCNKKKFDRKMWEKEANIMSQVSHVGCFNRFFRT
jgi:serine/threonine-protein kinase Chk2